MAGSCEYGDEPSGSDATELVKLCGLMPPYSWAGEVSHPLTLHNRSSLKSIVTESEDM
jgi:hypothetical protein